MHQRISSNRAVNDPLLVRRFEGLRDLLRNQERVPEWNRPFRDAIGQRWFLDQFHHQCNGPV